MKNIVVTSKNPVKTRAALAGFQAMFPEEVFNVIEFPTPSGVGDQPMSDEETLRGALNRVTNAHRDYTDADFYIGLEGGIEDSVGEMCLFAWVVIMSRDGRIGKGKTGTLFLPEQVSELVRHGMELGDADDAVFGSSNVKQKIGTVGLLTDGVIDRERYTAEAVVLALIPFKNEKFYF